jgi:predicted  nucleic acid-binding Zn-ribbon protein
MATAAQEIALMKQRIKSMEDKLDNLDNKLDTLTKQLLDPDDGFVVRVNKNTSFRLSHNEDQPIYDELLEEFKELQRWKATVSKALWGVYAAIVGSIIKLIFW